MVKVVVGYDYFGYNGYDYGVIVFGGYGDYVEMCCVDIGYGFVVLEIFEDGVLFVWCL